MRQTKILSVWISLYINDRHHTGFIRLSIYESKISIRSIFFRNFEIPLKDVLSCETGEESKSNQLILNDAVYVKHKTAGIPNFYITHHNPLKILAAFEKLGIPVYDRSNVRGRKILPVQILCFVSLLIVLLWVGLTSWALLEFLLLLLRAL